ncbi:MAG: MASE1 domain-containing protein, partial [Pseudomonadota bacterium]|nr:MASE1 domain-containing protein [Pseudomonadota bacterium]
MSSHWRTAVLPGAVSIVFLLLAGGGIFFTSSDAGISAIWLANGWVLGFMLAGEDRRWRHYLIATFIAHVVLVISAPLPEGQSLILALTNFGEIALSYFVARRYVSSPEHLFRPEALKQFVAWIVVAVPLLGSLIAAAMFALLDGEFVKTLQQRPVAHALGVIIMMPLVLAIRGNWNGWSIPLHMPAASWMPFVALLAASLLVFSQSRLPLLFLLFPPFLWVLFRHSYLGCAIAMLMISAIVMGSIALDTGPLMLIDQDGTSARVLILQLLLATLVITAYPLCMLLARKQDLLRSIALREQHLRIVTENSQDVIIHTDAEGRRTYVSPAIEDMLGYTVEQALGGRGSSAIHKDDRAMFE